MAEKGLESLLCGLSGVEGSVLSRPKSMNSMKESKDEFSRPSMYFSGTRPSVGRVTEMEQQPESSGAGAGCEQRVGYVATENQEVYNFDILDDQIEGSLLSDGAIKGRESRPSDNRNYIDNGFDELIVGRNATYSDAFREGNNFSAEEGTHEQQQQEWVGNPAELENDSMSAEDPLAIFGGTPCKSSISDGKHDESESSIREVEKIEQQDNASSLIHGGRSVQGDNHEDTVLEKESKGHDGPSCLPVFEHLDRKDRENVLGGTDVEEGHPGHHAGEAVAEFGHKAARAFQMGTKWFFHASKQIAKDVQSRIDARSGREKKHSRQSSITDSPKSDQQQDNYHQIWAIQLSKASPETRAASLGAMDEVDRMSVQRILDDQIWIERPQTQPAVSASPPSYDEVVVQDSFERTKKVEEKEEKTSALEKDSEASFDLLNLDGKENGEAEDSREWETGLFGNDGFKRDVESHEGDIEFMFESKNSARFGVLTKGPNQSATTFTGDADEPEIRRILREKRQAHERERIARQVATARDREAKETAEKEGKVAIREKLRPEMDAWSAGKKDNIRSLLCTMNTVLWEGSGWNPPTIADLMEPVRVKRWYMKANLVVHPDKVKQKEGTLEQLVRAEMIFDVLKTAWGIFQAKEL